MIMAMIRPDFRAWCFPPVSRSFRAKRWVKITIRTMHLIAVSGVGAGVFFGVGDGALIGFIHATWLTGAAFVALELWSNGVWLFQLRGWAVLVKLLLVVALVKFEQQRLLLFLAIMVISGVISHAPGSVRYYSLLHRRRIDILPERTR